MTLRCFVAMPFGHDDTDATYAVVSKTLREIGITTRRVDRIEHNDDIDDKIISEIRDADIVIADLTYARPSVYFEAGYAQRAIPVVYIARQDHFQSRSDDPHGHFQVHFDLKMRNIVSWSSPRDEVFRRRLKSRITKVIAPIVRQRHEDAHRKNQVSAFDDLSFGEKHKWLFQTASLYFSEIGYAVRDLNDSRVERDSMRLNPEMRRGAFEARRFSRGHFHYVFFQVAQSITAKLCLGYRIALTFPPYSFEGLWPPKTPPKSVTEDAILCSLGSGGLSRIRRNIPIVRSGEIDHTLSHHTSLDLSTRKKPHNIPRQITLHVVESSRNLVQLRETLAERFPSR